VVFFGFLFLFLFCFCFFFCSEPLIQICLPPHCPPFSSASDAILVALYIHYPNIYHQFSSSTSNIIPPTLASIHRRGFIDALLYNLGDPDSEDGKDILSIFDKCLSVDEPIGDINAYDDQGYGILWNNVNLVSLAPQVILDLLKRAHCDPRIADASEKTANLLGRMVNDFRFAHDSSPRYWTRQAKEIVKWCRERYGMNFLMEDYNSNRRLLVECFVDYKGRDLNEILTAEEIVKLGELKAELELNPPKK
jgi:hypothetical protein